MTNPHHPFVYRYFEIRHVGDRGDRFDADKLETLIALSWKLGSVVLRAGYSANADLVIREKNGILLDAAVSAQRRLRRFAYDP